MCVILFFRFVHHSKICYLAFSIYLVFSIYFVYILLFSIARNIVLVVIVISHDYSLPLSKLFCLKASLNLKERRGNFVRVLVKVVRSKMVQKKMVEKLWFNDGKKGAVLL